MHASFIGKVSMRRKEYIKKPYSKKKGKIYQTVYIPPLLYQIILSCEEVDNMIWYEKKKKKSISN